MIHYNNSYRRSIVVLRAYFVLTEDDIRKNESKTDSKNKDDTLFSGAYSQYIERAFLAYCTKVVRIVCLGFKENRIYSINRVIISLCLNVKISPDRR